MQDAIKIDAPLKGEWKFLRPPGHHPYAFDLVRMNAARTLPHNAGRLGFIVRRIASERFFAWGQPVYSPIAGRIIRVGDGWEDHHFTNVWKSISLWYKASFLFKPKLVHGRLDIRPNAGNHVMIRAHDGYIVFLAHFQNQSLLVAEGEQVQPGQLLGVVGNSGNSTMPHLHINLFDQMDDPYSARVLPFVFRNYASLDRAGCWREAHSALPRAGAFVRFPE